MVTKIAKATVDTALDAWDAARERAARECAAWDLLLKSQKTLIDSLRKNGHAFSQAQQEFSAMSEGHHEAYLAALIDENRKRAEYREIATRFNSQ